MPDHDYTGSYAAPDDAPLAVPYSFRGSLIGEEELDAVVAAVDRFRGRPELIAWVPEVRHLQHEQIFVNQERLRKADQVLEKLRDYAESIGGERR